MALATLLGGEFGNFASKRDREKEGEYLRDSRNLWYGLDEPTIDEQKLNLDLYDNPQLEQALAQGDTQLDSISLDPSTRNAQMQALAQLQAISEQGGMDSVDRARMADIMGQAASQAKGQRDAIAQNMQARGLAGSGMEMVQQQMANQNAAQMANQGGLQTAAAAQQRALDAIMGAGSMGANIRNQDYGIASDRAKAQDAINQFNTQNRQNVMGRNLDRTNAINTANTDLRNQQQINNKGLYQQRFENQVAKAQGASGANQALSDRYGRNAAATQQRWAAQGKAQDDMAMEGMKAGGSIAAMMSDERGKKDISNVTKADLKEFFGAIKPKFFKYKDQNNPLTAPGERVGFMLQDVQNTKLGKLITRKTKDGTLVYDKDNLNGIILAAFAMGV